MAKLIYQAGFDEAFHDPDTGLNLPALRPVFGVELGPLQLIQAPEPFLVGEPEERMDRLESPAGLRFTLLRDFPPADPPPSGQEGSIKDDCYVGAVVNPFPGDIQYFKIRATFELPSWEVKPEDADQRYGWAVVVFARKDRGDLTYQPTRDERTTVSMRSFKKVGGDPSAMLNDPGGTPDFGLPDFAPDTVIPESLYEGIFESDSAVLSTFSLELLIDRGWFKVARAGLDAWIYDLRAPVFTPDDRRPYGDRRWFTHPLVTDSTASIDSVGFAIGIASGKGTASVVIRDFRIYRLSLIDVALARFGIFTDWIWRVLSGQLERKKPA